MKAWPPTKTEIKRSFLLLIGSIFLSGVAGYVRQSREEGQVDALFIILFGILVGISLWLFLHLLILLPMKFIPPLAQRTEERGKQNGDEKKGAIIVRGGLWIYTLIFLTLQVMNIYESDGKHIAIKLIFGLFWLWMLYGVTKGIRAMRDFVAYLMIFGVIWLHRLPEMIQGSYYQQLLSVQVLFGVLLGLALLFSKHAG